MKWNPGSLTDLATGYWHSAALLAGVRLGVFTALKDGPRDAAALAETCNCSARHLAALLDALCGIGLLERAANDGYALEDSAAPLLTPDSPLSMLGAMHYNADLYSLWGALADGISRGEPVAPPQAHLGDDPELTQRFVMGMHSRALGLAPALIPHFGLSGTDRLLDIGAGPGTFSRLTAEATDGLAVTQFDLPPVLAIAEGLAAGSSAADRISYSPGDYRADPFPTGFSAVLYFGALHQESHETAAVVFRKAAEALEPGGRFIVGDMMLAPSRTEPVFSALFGLNMLLTSPIGHMFSSDEVESIMQDVGLSEITCVAVPHTPYWIVSGVKPA